MARINNFDALRLVGALMVLLTHMAPASGRPTWTWMGNSFGTLGVLIFFSISGYLITASWRAEPDLGRFLVKRYLRVVPGLAVAMAACWLIVAALGLQGFPDNPRHDFNMSLWTIPLEVYCYVILAGAGMLVARPALVCAAAALGAYLLLPFDFFTCYALFFAAGALFQEYPALLNWRVVGLLVAAGLAVAMLGEENLGMALAIPALTVWIGRQSWPVLRDAGRFGDLSYGVYIYAYPMQQVVVSLMGASASYYALSAASLAVVLPLAWLSWRYVEAPALARKPVREPRTSAPIPQSSQSAPSPSAQ
jgi:peptidoglycan/LPS O-acetylase OafA/YrhL